MTAARKTSREAPGDASRSSAIDATRRTAPAERDASHAAGANAYQVTIDHQDDTSETYATARDDAYALVLGELANPTPGVCRVDIRPQEAEDAR